MKTYVIKAFLVGLLCSSVGNCNPPSPKANYVPIVLVNNTQNAEITDLYFLAHGLDSSGLPCYLVPGKNGICSYVYPNVGGKPPSSESPTISVKFSSLPQATNLPSSVTGDARLIYMPICSSGRAYISVNKPMYLPTQFNPAPQRLVLDIGDSSVTAFNDVNFYTLYQDFEFGLVNYNNTNNQVGTLATTYFVNLSYVDYFCLPMQMVCYSYPSNVQNTQQPYSGTKPTLTRESIITSLQTAFNNSPYGSSSWVNLQIPFYSDPYSTSNTSTSGLAGITRVLAAKNSIALGSTTAPAGVTPAWSFFPASYASNPTNYSAKSSESYFSSLLDYYSNPSNALFLAIVAAGGINSTYKMTATTTPAQLVFTQVAGGGATTTLPVLTNGSTSLTELTTEELLSGSLWPFTGTSSVGDTNELSKAVSSLFSIGQMPLIASPSSLGSPFKVTSYQSSSDPGGFASLPEGANNTPYFNSENSNLGWIVSSGPWFNLYDYQLHTLMQGVSPAPNLASTSLGLAYGYDYDDVLNMAGLMSVAIQDSFAQPYVSVGSPSEDQPYFIITIGDMSGTNVSGMDIDNDSYTYSNVQFGPVDNGLDVVYQFYDPTLGSIQTVTAPTAGNSSVYSVQVGNGHPPLTITIKYDGVQYQYSLNLKRQLALPVNTTNPFSSIDLQFLESVEFGVSSSSHSDNPSFLINIGDVIPGWPG